MPPAKRSTRVAAATKPTTAQAAAPRATTTTTRAARAARDDEPPTAAGHPAPLARKLDSAAADDDDDDDSANSGNDSDSLAISNRPARSFRRPGGGAGGAQGYVMTGALGEGDVAGAHLAARRRRTGRAAAAAAAPAATAAAAVATKTETNSGRNVRTKGRMGGVTKQRRDPEQERALEALRRRRAEMLGVADGGGRAGAGAGAGTGATVESEGEEAVEDRGRRQEVPATASRVRRASSSHWSNAMPGSAVKAQGTPAAERSVLALTKFKPRRRQGSLLQMVNQSDVEDGGGDDDDLDDSAATLDYSLGDFEPDHESTPLNLARKGSFGAALPGSEPRTSSSRKRKMADRDEAIEESTVQVPQSSPPPPAVPTDEAVNDGDKTSSEHLYAEASETPGVVEDTQPEGEEEAADVTAAEVTAPTQPSSPLSSLPAEPEPEEAPAKRPRRAAARRTTSNSRTTRELSNTSVEEDHAADPLSSSDLDSDTATETPVPARTSRKKTNARKAKALPLSTATLQSLLPRRRKQLTTRSAKTATAGTFEIPSSSDAEEEDGEEEGVEAESVDEDELQRPPRAARAGKGGKSSAAKASGNASRAKKQPLGAATKEKKGRKRPSRTYGRRSSDKENQEADTSLYVRSGDENSDGEDVIETSETKEIKRSKELEAAAKKFKEIDDWEMEFESVDMGGASASSPWR